MRMHNLDLDGAKRKRGGYAGAIIGGMAFFIAAALVVGFVVGCVR